MKVLGQRFLDPISADQMEVWPLPAEITEVVCRGDELSARCPVTSSPDIYRWEIRHGGTQELESKALKLYLLGYRDQGISCAALAAQIARDVGGMLDTEVTVKLVQNVRGGIQLEATAQWQP